MKKGKRLKGKIYNNLKVLIQLTYFTIFIVTSSMVTIAEAFGGTIKSKAIWPILIISGLLTLGKVIFMDTQKLLKILGDERG